jgi:beta-glucanase (GH16 family)
MMPRRGNTLIIVRSLVLTFLALVFTPLAVQAANPVRSAVADGRTIATSARDTAVVRAPVRPAGVADDNRVCDEREDDADQDRNPRSAAANDRGPDCRYTIAGTISPPADGAGSIVNLGGTLSATTTADRHGRFRFVGLARGIYSVMLSKAGYSFTPPARTVSITTSNTKHIDFSVSPGHSVSGVITPPADGAGTIVTLSGGQTTTADSAGAYRVTGIADGTYTVTPSKAGVTFSPPSQIVTLSGSDAASVNFTAGEHVIFFDDFSGATVDSAQWTTMDRSGDQSNSELQCYRPANVMTADGSLQIVSQAQPVICDGNAFNYTSGMVQWTHFNFTYGTVEIRARLAGGQGTWPTLWFLGADCQASNIVSADNTGPCHWPDPGSDEIDMTEVMQGAVWEVNQQVHSGANNSGCQPLTTDVSQNWHTYSLYWAPDSLVWKIDDVPTCSITEGVPSTPMFLMINTAIGGIGGGTVDDATLPQSLVVDYVKVTQK